MVNYFYLTIVGLITGLVGGLLGGGSEILIVPLLTLFGLLGNIKNRIGTSLFMLLPPIGIFAAYKFYKDGKETIANFEKEHKGKVLLKKEDMNTVLRMRNKIYSYEECDTLLNSGGIAEQVSVWEDKDTGVLCKCKADYVNLEEGYIVDIKTTTDANPDTFVHTIRKYGYDKQSAFYSDAFGVKDFYFIVIEKTYPYNIGVYKCSEETMNTGRIKYKNLLCVYKDYFIEKNYEIESFLWQREI